MRIKEIKGIEIQVQVKLPFSFWSQESTTHTLMSSLNNDFLQLFNYKAIACVYCHTGYIRSWLQTGAVINNASFLRNIVLYIMWKHWLYWPALEYMAPLPPFHLSPLIISLFSEGISIPLQQNWDFKFLILNLIMLCLKSGPTFACQCHLDTSCRYPQRQSHWILPPFPWAMLIVSSQSRKDEWSQQFPNVVSFKQATLS